MCQWQGTPSANAWLSKNNLNMCILNAPLFEIFVHKIFSTMVTKYLISVHLKALALLEIYKFSRREEGKLQIKSIDLFVNF